MLRDSTIDRMASQRFDVAIIGGGINGAVSAAALAGQGASVALVDRGDFGGFTSQESSNLVWGGIKYLQTYELPLVWSLCGSRNRLMRSFPTRIQQMPFLAALGDTAPFSLGLGALGVGAYWALGRFHTRAPRVYSAGAAKELEPLLRADGLRGAVRYNDAVLVDNDARFVWGFVHKAMQRGATATNYVEMHHAEKGIAGWRLHLRDVLSGQQFTIDADLVVNAAGPFADQLSTVFGTRSRYHLALSKGVHLVVRALGRNDRILAFFDDDGRLFYVIPMHDRTVIGTTDTRVTNPEACITDEDRRFILDQANRRLDLTRPLTTADIVAERCGVRSLVVSEGQDVLEEDWMALSRKHRIEVDGDRRVVTVLGGKLTDCLNVGDEITRIGKQLGIPLGPRHRWYGEDAPRYRQNLLNLATQMRVRSDANQTEHLVGALWRRQGARSFRVLEGWGADPASAEVLFDGTDITRGEFTLMARTEMIVHLDDLLRRRTPLSQIRSRNELVAHPATKELAGLLFGATADQALARTFGAGIGVDEGRG